MSDKKTRNILNIDQEKFCIERVVTALYHNVLRDYTAYANRDDVMNGLYKFFEYSEIAVISKVQLRQYEEMKKLIIDTSTDPLNFLKINK